RRSEARRLDCSRQSDPRRADQGRGSNMKNRDRRDAQVRGQIEIHKPTLIQFVKKFPTFRWLTEDYRFRGETEAVYLPVRKLTVEHLDSLVELMEKAVPRPRSTISQIRSHLEV